jgi:hypothetical protein
VAVAEEGSGEHPLLVDPAISRAKLDRQVAQWQSNVEDYRRRGMQLARVGDLAVEVVFTARIGLNQLIPVVTACARIEYDNYDRWAPSVTFIDFFNREPCVPPVGARKWVDGVEQNVLIGGHPRTGRPFLCIPGVREYHEHGEHSGDDWLLHRSQGAGTLGAICELIWQRMVRNVVGVRAESHVLRTPDGQYVGQSRWTLVQGDLDSVGVQVEVQPDGPLPPNLPEELAQMLARGGSAPPEPADARAA